jgi:hypothetical protein
MQWSPGKRLAPWITGLALVASGCALGCTPNASGAAGSGDASADARAPRTASTSSDGGASDAQAALEADAAPPDDTNLPAASGDELTTRAKHLLEAIAHDNADLGVDMIFPREAYIAARDASDPGKAWDIKVVGAFRRSVHALHRRSTGIERAQFVSFELGHSVVQITPKKRDWKRPLWRVHRSKLTYTVDGRTQRIEIGELTSWRGNWYVTRLR